MTSSDRFEEVVAVVTGYVRDDLLFRRPEIDLGTDTDLIETGVVDSVGLFRLVGFLEDSFGLSIPPEEIVPDNMASIDAIARYVVGKRGGS